MVRVRLQRAIGVVSGLGGGTENQLGSGKSEGGKKLAKKSGPKKRFSTQKSLG